MKPKEYPCTSPGCENVVSAARRAIGRYTCTQCGERSAVRERASWCVAPMHKSNYMLVTQREDLVGLNNKGGLVK